MRRSLFAILGLLAAVTPLRAQEIDESCRVWARVEYLAWWIRGDHAPLPLATTGPAGAPAAEVLIGPGLNYRFNNGGKLWLGAWLDSAGTIGVEASGFTLETHTTHEKAASDRATGAPLIARPFVNALTGQADAQIVTAPADALGGRYLGGVNLFGDSRTWGGELNLLFNAAITPQGRWDLVGGFRYLGQKDQLQLDDASTVLRAGSVAFAGTPAAAPNIVSQRDYLETDNSFYGGQLGVQGHWQSAVWVVDAGARAGLGITEQHLEAIGRTLLTGAGGGTQYQPGGLFVPPNLSQLDRARLGLVSEVNVRVGYRITERCVASVGYTFLFWSDVLRPAGQLGPVDPRQVPSNLAFNPVAGAAAFQVHGSAFWAQGLTAGLEYRY
jgi:hypothetical protein